MELCLLTVDWKIKFEMYHSRPHIQDTIHTHIPPFKHSWLLFCLERHNIQRVSHALSHRATLSHPMSSRSLVEQLFI